MSLNVKSFKCNHLKTGVEYYFPCCDKWGSCGTCHKIEGCVRMKKPGTLRCLTCLSETTTVGNGKCANCSAKWGVNPCLVCNVVTYLGDFFRHCDKCDLCVRADYKHCDTCDSCFCGNSGKPKCYWSKECPICYEKVEGNALLMFGRIRLSDCGHNFHWKCFDEWYKSGHYTCPICRATFDIHRSVKSIPDTYHPSKVG